MFNLDNEQSIGQDVQDSKNELLDGKNEVLDVKNDVQDRPDNEQPIQNKEEDSYEKLKSRGLQQILELQGKPKSGNKAELIRRLQGISMGHSFVIEDTNFETNELTKDSFRLVSNLSDTGSNVALFLVSMMEHDSNSN